jgi:NADPH:quinone reductase-like Zn-dependent oxidoreductase
MMAACRVHWFGPPEVITIEDIERPTPGPGQVLVRVIAAGVGPWDAWIRAGRSVLPQPLPLTLGSDISGEVVATGPDVTGFKPGDAVFGVTNKRFTGGYAEFALAEAATIAPRPTRMDPIEAASLPVVSATAQQAIERAGIVAGRTVLIHGGAGSVGGIAVQLAHRAGTRVIATAGERDLAYVRGLGADQVVDYRATRFEDAIASGVDGVLDFAGGETQARSFAVLRRGGQLVSAVSEPDQDLARARGVSAGFFLVDVTSERLASIAAQFDAGALAGDIGAVLPLASARVAHEMLEGARPRPRGKIVLSIAP